MCVCVLFWIPERVCLLSTNESHQRKPSQGPPLVQLGFPSFPHPCSSKLIHAIGKPPENSMHMEKSGVVPYGKLKYFLWRNDWHSMALNCSISHTTFPLPFYYSYIYLWRFANYAQFPQEACCCLGCPAIAKPCFTFKAYIVNHFVDSL